MRLLRFKVGPLLILNEDESPLVYLDTEATQITEKADLNSFREISVTHPLKHKDGRDYSQFIKPGKKVFWFNTTEGDSCLYVIDGAVKADYDANSISFTAHEVAAELQDLPPVWVDPAVSDEFLDASISSIWTLQTNGGTITEGKGYLSLYAPSGAKCIWGGSTYKSPCIAKISLLEGNSFTVMAKMEQRDTINLNAAFGLTITDSTNYGYVRIGRHKNSSDGKIYIRSDYRVPGSNEVELQGEEYKDLPNNSPLWFKIEVDSTGKVTPSWTVDLKEWTNHTTYTLSSWTPTQAGVYVRNWVYQSSYNAIKAYVHSFSYIPWKGRVVDITSSYLNGLTGNRFTVSSIPSGLKARLGGLLDPYSIIKKACEDNDLLLFFEYDYDVDTDTISRYMKLVEDSGEIKGVIDFGEDVGSLDITIDESSTYAAVAPKIDDLNDIDQIIPILDEFRNMSVSKGSNIASHVYVDQQKNYVYGPNVAAPFAKASNSYMLTADNSNANYQKVKVPNVPDEYRVAYVNITRADHHINLYWTLAEKLSSLISTKLTINFDYFERDADISQFRYRVGDWIVLRIPGYDEGIQFRVQSTEKNPHEPASLKMGLGDEPIRFTKLHKRR